MSKFISHNNETHQELALMALVASPTPEDACAFLQAEHNLTTTPANLKVLARTRADQYEELRERVAPMKEQILTHNLMDNALYASEVTQVAMEQLMKRLEEGKIRPEYLSKVARDIADVQSKAVDKKLSLEGRPTHIVEQRTPDEIIRQLERKGVVKRVEIEQG